MKATVHVFLKPGVLDVQGKAVENALHGLGWPGVGDVRVGRVIEFEAPGDRAEVEAQVKAMCERLLANTVIESYRVELGVKAAVVVFPGSNCDRDCKTALERAAGARVEMVWHGETALPAGLDLIVLPGGFAYGDYLRCGAMAALSPVMAEVKAAADRGVAVVGICNGFQVLCEARMLPGALLSNVGLKYICKRVDLDVVNAQTRFTARYGDQRVVTMTVGNGEGNYFADDETLGRLEDEGQVVFRYRDNPNGSAHDIAGIINGRGNVLGMMPHPDRAFEAELGSSDGALLFQSVLASA